MKPTFVTGGAGFVGSHIVRALLARGRGVRVLHLPNEPLDNLKGLDVELVAGDVRDYDAMRSAIHGCERVFHVAALYALWLRDPKRLFEVNVQGTRNVLEASIQEGVARVVFTSSIGAFGGQGLDCDATEASECGLPATGDLYALSKLEAQKVAETYAARLDVRIAAPCGPLGPGDIGPTPTGRLLLSTVNLPFCLVTDTVSNMVDVRDVAEGHLLVEERGRRGQTYLLGGENCALTDLARRSMRCVGIEKPVLALSPRSLELAGWMAVTYAKACSELSDSRLHALAPKAGSVPLVTPAAARIARLGLRADCTKAKTELGYSPRPIDTAIHDALLWFAERGYVTNRRAKAALAA
jgi:dihydroflavonol-4-reductase